MANRSPAYCRQKCSGRFDRAFVVLDDRRHYLGRGNGPESRPRFHRLLAEREAVGGRLPSVAEDMTVADLDTTKALDIMAQYG